MTHPYVFALLKNKGHSAFKAAEIVLDANRGDRWALDWVRMCFKLRHSECRS